MRLKESQNQYKSTTYQAFLKLYQYIVAEMPMNHAYLVIGAFPAWQPPNRSCAQNDQK
jgi:hypothetical protein